MVTIGRDTKNDIVLKDASVSAEHACIVAINGRRLVVRDMGTRSGTFLWREERWTQALLIHLGAQDRIRFGNYEMSWKDLTEASAGFGVGTAIDKGKVRLLVPGRTSDKPVFENPKRNPVTGTVEEREPDPL